jgi:hypothetical protein
MSFIINPYRFQSTLPPFVNEYSMTFDGVGDFIKLNELGLDITGAIAVSAWVKTTDTSATFRTIVGEYTSISSSRSWVLYLGNTQLVGFITYNDSNAININLSGGQNLINDGQWHHVLGTWDGTTNVDSAKLYIDGSLIASSTPPQTTTKNLIGLPTYIGQYATNNARWIGEIDEVAIWNTDQSSNIAELSSAPIDLTSYNPLSWYRMGDNDTFYNMVNGLLNSDNINGWVRTNLNDTGTPPYSNVEVAPDGLTTADKMIEDTATSSHFITHGTIITSGVDYNISCYLKAGERTKVFIRTDIDGTNISNCDLDLTTGVISNNNFPNDVVVTDEGNGWWRFSTYINSGFTGSRNTIYVYLRDALDQLNYIGDGTSGCYIWGLQLSTSQNVLSYFPTTGIIRYLNSWVTLDNGSEGNNGVSTSMPEGARVTDVP